MQPAVDQPIAARTRSSRIQLQLEGDGGLHTGLSAHRIRSKHKARSGWALSVMDPDTGKTLEYRQLRRHPKLGPTWDRSGAKELGRLCQGLGGKNGTPKIVDGTDTFRPIQYEDVPHHRRREVTYVKIVCTVKPDKADPNRTRITIGGDRIAYPGDVGTKTASLDLVKLVINSVLSRKDAKFVCFDISNFYLGTPLDRPEYARVNTRDIPVEFYDEYNLQHFEHDGWVYFEITKGVYGLPQAGILANRLLEERLTLKGYYQCPQTPGLWRHKWRPIMFSLVVDDFGVEYVGKRHADHLRDALKEHYDITENWDGDLYVGINLDWNYAERSCRLTMRDYILNLLRRLGHPAPRKPQHSPHAHAPIQYGQKQQYVATPPASKPLDDAGTTRVRMIVGSLLYYARAVNNKLLVALGSIAEQQSCATTLTDQAVGQLLDYVSTYPDDGITYRASTMVLAAHSDAGYLNASKARSRAGAHIMLSEDDPVPRINGPVLTVAQVIKSVMSSAAEAELGATFLCAKEMVPLRQTLIEMGWPQPPSPIQVDNSTAVGVANSTIIPKRTKAMDMRFHWLRCREAQGQFRFFWAPGSDNLADYSTKHHPPQYHLAHRRTRGAWF